MEYRRYNFDRSNSAVSLTVKFLSETCLLTCALIAHQCNSFQSSNFFQLLHFKEIFFKTIKQNLRVKKFYGQSQNAVETQIWVALIVYVLYLKLRQMSTYEGKNFTDLISELKVCLFERKDLFGWFVALPPVINKPPSLSSQQELAL